MQNSTRPSNPEPLTTHTEHVTPWNGKREDRWVLLTLLTMLLVATALMQWLYPAKDSVTIKIPNEIRQQLTSLSNAAEEIRMIQAFDGQQPNLETLENMAIAPFSQVQLAGMAELHWTQTSDCYIAFGQYPGQHTGPIKASPTPDNASQQAFQLALYFPSTRQQSNHNHVEVTEHDSYTIRWRLLDSSNMITHESNHATICDDTQALDSWHAFTPRSQTH